MWWSSVEVILLGHLVAMLLQCRQATVTVVHSYAPNPAEVTKRADIVVAAVGVAHLVQGDWIKPGAVVIDVGINAVNDPSEKKGYRLFGDICFKEASMKASAITPVPGGVGRICFCPTHWTQQRGPMANLINVNFFGSPMLSKDIGGEDKLL